MTYKIPESVLVVIHTKELEVLLIERADQRGFWQSVTGSKNFLQEELAATARREVAEETGIQIESSDTPFPAPADFQLAAGNLRDWQLSTVYAIYPYWRHRYAPQVTHNAEHAFSLLVPRNCTITLNPREHVQYCWLPYRLAAEKCFSGSNAAAILQLPLRVGAVVRPSDVSSDAPDSPAGAPGA